MNDRNACIEVICGLKAIYSKREVIDMVNEKSLKNLKPYSAESARVNGRKGGLKAVESKRKKKSLREYAIIFGETECSREMKDKLRECGISEEHFINNMAIIFSLYKSALRGNVGAVRLILELTGELKQHTAVTVTNNVSPYAGLTEEELRILANL